MKNHLKTKPKTTGIPNENHHCTNENHFHTNEKPSIYQENELISHLFTNKKTAENRIKPLLYQQIDRTGQ